MQYTETQLSKLIEDVEKEFTAHLAKAEEKETSLSKSEDGKPPKEKEEKKPEAEHSENQAGPKHGAPAPEEKEAPAAEANHAAPAPTSSGYDDEDKAHMRQMYASMSQEELKDHHDCIADLAKCGGGMAMGKSEDEVAGGIGGHRSENPGQPKVHGDNLDNDPKNGGIEGQEPNNALGPKSPASDANGAKINKSEFARRNGGKIEGQQPTGSPGAKSEASKEQGVQMQKSENIEAELLKSELAQKQTEFEDLKKNYDAVASFLTTLVKKTGAPQGKAITDLSVIAKSEGAQEEKVLNKTEIDSILIKKASDPTLKKSDRDAINTYYLGDKDIKGISHLLK